MFSKDVCELNVGMWWDLALKRGRAESWCWVWCPGPVPAAGTSYRRGPRANCTVRNAFCIDQRGEDGEMFERDLLGGDSVLISGKIKSFRGRRQLFAACATMASHSPSNS